MKRLALVFAAVALAVVCALLWTPSRAAAEPRQDAPAAQQSSPIPAAPPESVPPDIASASALQTIAAYTLPPDLYKKARQLNQIAFWGQFGIFFYSLAVLLLFLKWRLGPKYRNWSESASSNFLLQALIFAPLFVLTIDILELPIGVLDNWVLRKFGLSVQGWASWSWDWTKGEFVNVILGVILILVLYAALRKSPRRWWFYFWLASLPLVFLLILAQPLVIDPLFHKYEPLATKNPALTASLEQIVQRAGQDIPPERMFWMNASEKVNELNAYVTGIGSSKRIVLWDTTIAKLTTPEIVAVIGHEMGHYVLNHVTKGLIAYATGALIFFYLGFRCIGWVLARWGATWEIRGVEDWASLPVLVLLLTVFSFGLTPVTNAVSRYFEHQADQYALEVTHGVTPDSGQVAAQSFQALGEVNLEYPDPSPLDVLMLFDHPPIRDRVHFSLTYDPWANGGHGEFVH